MPEPDCAIWGLLGLLLCVALAGVWWGWRIWVEIARLDARYRRL